MKPLKSWSLAEVMAFLRGVDRRTWMIILAGTIGVLFILCFVVIPAWIERPILRRDIQMMETQIRQIQDLNKKRPQWEEDRKTFGALIEEARVRIFTDKDMEMLLGTVSKMAGEARVDMLASKPSDTKTVFAAPYQLQYQPNGYEFSVQGDYHQIGDFVSRIEGYDKLLRVRSLEIVPSEKTPERHIANLVLWAIIKAPPPPPPVPKKAAKKTAKVKNAKT